MRCATSYWAAFSCPHIPDGREANRAGLDGQSDILRPQRQGLPAQEYNQKEGQASHIYLLRGKKSLKEAPRNEINDQPGFRVFQNEIVTDDSVGNS